MATPNFKLIRWNSDDNQPCCWAVYVVLNPAWNKRLFELANVEALAETPQWADSFKEYIADELDADHIQSIEKGLKSDRFYFMALYLD